MVKFVKPSYEFVVQDCVDKGYSFTHASDSDYNTSVIGISDVYVFSVKAFAFGTFNFYPVLIVRFDKGYQNSQRVCRSLLAGSGSYNGRSFDIRSSFDGTDDVFYAGATPASCEKVIELIHTHNNWLLDLRAPAIKSILNEADVEWVNTLKKGAYANLEDWEKQMVPEDRFKRLVKSDDDEDA